MRLVFSLLTALLASAENWPQWRGPSLNGISSEKGLPVHWTPEKDITWKLSLPEWSGSTPAIWGDLIFLNVAEGDGLSLWCVDRNGPTVLWKRPMGAGNVKMRKQNMSSPSPMTDGSGVWAITGTGSLKAFDNKGKELWARDIQKEYGKFGLNWGYASSPLLYEDSLYVQVLHGMHTSDPSYVLRVDKKTGKTLWRVERPTKAIRESPDSYSTPTLVWVNKKPQLVVSGGDIVTAHDLATGKELWRGTGFNPNNNPNYRTIASSVVSGDLVFTPSRERPLLVYRAGGQGDVTASNKVWEFDHGPDVPTPLVDKGLFYSINDRGIAWCLDAQTGKEIWGSKRLKPGTYSASPVLADGKIYITSEEGLTSVLKAGPEFEILAENPLDDYTLSSPAVSDGQIFIRTAKYLWCIGKRSSK